MSSFYKVKISFNSKDDNTVPKPVKGEYFRPFFNDVSQKSDSDGVVKFETDLTDNYNEKIYLLYKNSNQPLGNVKYNLNSNNISGDAQIILSYSQALSLGLA